MSVKRKFNLSVDHTGRVSLWDSVAKAQRGKEAHEIVIRLQLTLTQLSALESARKQSRSLKFADDGIRTEIV